MEKMKGIPQINALIKKRNGLIGKLHNYEHILRGTIIERGNICGKPGCRCKRKDTPLLHGPYKYLSHRSRTKTNMIFLNKKKLKYAQEGIRSYRELIDLIYQISEINFKILRYHYRRLKGD
ncbi:MAG: DUF6788 family protein [bacterium]